MLSVNVFPIKYLNEINLSIFPQSINCAIQYVGNTGSTSKSRARARFTITDTCMHAVLHVHVLGFLNDSRITMNSRFQTVILFRNRILILILYIKVSSQLVKYHIFNR